MMALPALILSGGASSRMGAPKALVPVGDVPLAVHLLRGLASAGFGPVVLVTGAHDSEIQSDPAVAKAFGSRIVANANWRLGPGSSIRAGVVALGGVETIGAGLLVTPVDLPAAAAEDWRTMCIRFSNTNRTQCVAHGPQAEPGAPVLFAKEDLARWLAAPDDIGARAWLRANSAGIDVLNLAGLAADADTPEDLKRVSGGG